MGSPLNDRTPLISGRDNASKTKSWSTASRIVATIVGVAVVALAVFVVKPGGPLFSGGYRNGLAVKDANPWFFRDGATITGAKIVRHNWGVQTFFDANEGLEMEPVTPEMTGWEFDWEEGRFYLQTDQVDNEWGFALVNNFGDHLYEVGSGPGAPLWGQYCPDIGVFANEYNQFFNRVMFKEMNISSPGVNGRMEYIFGSCESECPLIPFDQWTDEQRAAETARTKKTPPNTLGSEFVMYGTAGNGVCTMDLFASTNGGDDIIFHFNPRDWTRNGVMNSRVNGAWQSEVYTDWPFGPVGNTASTYQWKVKFKFETGYMDIKKCTDWYDDNSCVAWLQFNYRNGNDGYKDTSRINVHAGNALNLIRGNCYFYATWAGLYKNMEY